MIIACEGLDASGKATQTKILTERLRASGRKAGLQSFPEYLTPIGKLIQQVLTRQRVLHRPTEPFTGAMAYTESPELDTAHVLQALMLTNKHEVMNALVLEEDYEVLRGDVSSTEPVLVLDRYWGSALAYGAADGLDPAWLERIHDGLPEANWLYLDVTVDESFKRRPERRDGMYEARRDKLEAVRKNYLAIAKTRGWTVIDGMGSVEDVSDRIWSAVKGWL